MKQTYKNYQLKKQIKRTWREFLEFAVFLLLMPIYPIAWVIEKYRNEEVRAEKRNVRSRVDYNLNKVYEVFEDCKYYPNDTFKIYVTNMSASVESNVRWEKREKENIEVVSFFGTGSNSALEILKNDESFEMVEVTKKEIFYGLNETYWNDETKVVYEIKKRA